MIPLSTLLVSWVCAYVFSDKPTGGMFDANISGFMWVFAGILVSICLFVGHFL
jgi:hypothetical protein